MKQNIQDLITQLISTGMIKHGNFVLKSGMRSDVYLDIRSAISYPIIFRMICDLYHATIRGLSFDFICGVPYAALTFVSAIAYQHNIPMLLQRKEIKTHGTKKILEGDYQFGDRCVVVEDVITTGSSVLDTVRILREHGLVVQDICVLVDRSNNQLHEKFAQVNCVLHSIMQLSDIQQKE